MEPQEVSPTQVLEAMVVVVATLDKLVVTMTRPYTGMRSAAYPKSLHAALRSFTWLLIDTLGHRNVPSLGQALAACKTTPGLTWADVRAMASAWQESVAALIAGWSRLVEEVSKVHNTCREVITDAASTAATAAAQVGDLGDKFIRCLDSGDNLVAMVKQLPVTLSNAEVTSLGALHEVASEAEAANKAMRDAIVADSRARAAASRVWELEVAQEMVKHLVTACNRATVFPEGLQRRLQVIEAALEGTEEASPDVPEALVATVAEAKQLWDASASLFTEHLLGALGDIQARLSSPCGGRSGRMVAKWHRKAIQDIPRLLQDSAVTTVTSSGQ